MKTDRLYAITVYLLNHGKSSANELARRFEVSVRTIQRDIDALCRAGIPVVAELGKSGGYYLSESFKMDAHTVTNEDYSYMLTALKGFASAMDNQKLKEHFWFGTLLSLGDSVEILSPDYIRARVLKAAKKIISLYE